MVKNKVKVSSNYAERIFEIDEKVEWPIEDLGLIKIRRSTS